MSTAETGPPAAPAPPVWAVVVVAAGNLVLGLPVALGLGVLLDPGHTSDPDVVAALGWLLLLGPLALAVVLDASWQALVTGWRPALALVAALGLAAPTCLAALAG